MANHTAPALRRDLSRRGAGVAVRVSLLIPSHALPAFSYRVPERLVGEVYVGSAVVAPLSGYSRLGVVVGFEEAGDRPLKEIRGVAKTFSLPESLVKLCKWVAGAAALPLHAVLRMALPPGLRINAYEIRHPAPDWPWKEGSIVGRVKLRRTLGGEGLKAAEETGRIALTPALTAQRTVEWAVVEDANSDLRRAPRQRALFKALVGNDRGRPVPDLLSAAAADRDALRRLVRRGAVRLEKRPEPAPTSYTKGSGVDLAAFWEGVKHGLSRGGAWVWRIPNAENAVAAAAVARAAVKRGEQALVLAPEIKDVEQLVKAFERLLPAGLTVAPYHSARRQSRTAVYGAVRRGEVDVLVGTRAAVLVPVARLGAICVVDEPNEAHRGSSDYEGVPLHVRDLAIARGRIEGAAVFFFSPTPSLRLYAPESGVRRLPPREPAEWPTVAVVDMRGTGALLSPALLGACRLTVRSGRRIGVLVNRLQASNFSCNRCGFVLRCPVCDLPLGLHMASWGANSLYCGHCGHKESAPEECPACGSDRLSSFGLTAERVRKELAGSLHVEVGLHTAGIQEGGEAPVVVGTARYVLQRRWDLVVIPDADSLLFGVAGSSEKGFRILYRAAEASRDRLLVQTRSPENHVLRAAVQGDYEAFAAAELPKRRALRYPPHAHLAQVIFEGSEERVRRAVESELRPALGIGVEMLDPAPFPGSGGCPVWRVLLRSSRRTALTQATSLVARLAAETRGGLNARINMDPEEA